MGARRFRLGDRVTVRVNGFNEILSVITKDDPTQALIKKMRRRVGIVVGFVTGGNTGDSGRDPLIEVRFSHNVQYHFWTEELKHHEEAVKPEA